MSTKIWAMLLTLMAGMLWTNASGGWFGPSNYDDCVLDKMKGVTSDIAAREIKLACRSKFPFEVTPLTKEQEIKDKKLLDEWNPHPLTAQERASIKTLGVHPVGVDGVVAWLNQKIYNGNAKLTVCSITYKYRLLPNGEWSNIFRWTFDEKAGGPLKPYETKNVTVDTSSQGRVYEKSLSKKGGGIQYDFIEVVGAASDSLSALLCV